MLRKPGPVDFALIGLVVLVWASAFPMIKVAAPEVGPVWTAAIRVWIGLAVLGPYALWRVARAGWVAPTGGEWRLIVVLAFLNVVLPFMLISWAELTIPASVTALLMGTGPIWALLLSHVLTDDDRLNAYKLIGAVMGLVGVGLVVGPEAWSGLGGPTMLAQGAAFAGSLCYVVSGVLVRRVSRIPPVRLSALVLTLAAVQFVPLVVLLGRDWGAPASTFWQGASAQAWGALVYLGLVPTGVAYIVRYHLINAIGYSYLALGINLLPVIGVALSALLLGEPVTAAMVAALALILAGLAVARRGT